MEYLYYSNKYCEEKSGVVISKEIYSQMMHDFDIIENALKIISQGIYVTDNWTTNFATKILYHIKHADYGNGKTFPIIDVAKIIYDNTNQINKEKTEIDSNRRYCY